MRISDLSRAADVPVATIKYYLREGLLPAGRHLSRTQSDYDGTHVERLRLIRALAEVGGLGIARIGRILEAIDTPTTDRLAVLEAAQRALTVPPDEETAAGDADVAADAPGPSRALAWVQERGWSVDPADPVLTDLDRAWDACDAGELGIDARRLDAYADGIELIARADVSSVPDDPSRAVRQVVLGTVLMDPVLSALRRLAQQHMAVTGQVLAAQSPLGGDVTSR
ncbi:MerR family transcriptional regulator [Brachybacterium sp. AOP25-B2-12]|uniref:MerR family transcriptional regulator n=1 Tax=Brachybacterium sp. AOP25-B2-12 TaxID=3457710 RepID=UPI004034554D